ncbi:MAG: hypothetical protein ACTSRU_16215 [Candidatus Hodarchaeales archaeon]
MKSEKIINPNDSCLICDGDRPSYKETIDQSRKRYKQEMIPPQYMRRLQRGYWICDSCRNDNPGLRDLIESYWELEDIYKKETKKYRDDVDSCRSELWKRVNELLMESD